MKAISLLHYLQPYFETGVLLAFGYFLFAGLYRLGARLSQRSSAAAWLRIGQWCLIAALVFPFAAQRLPREKLFRPTAQIWSEPGRPRTDESYAFVAAPARGRISPSGLRLSIDALATIVALTALGILLMLARLIATLGKLKGFADGLPAIKSIGRVRVLVSDRADIPFSFCYGRLAYVVLPAALTLRPDDWRIALRHEIQHHRQGDTRWAQAVEVLKAVFFWNPAVYGWARLFARAQEFACDEVLLDRRKISPEAYGGCLLWAAEHAVQRRALPVGTTGMGATSGGNFLKRRIEMITHDRRHEATWRLPIVLGVGTLILLGSAAFAARSAIQDRELALADGEALAVKTAGVTEIPLAMNELVLKQLNRFVGTADGREFIRKSLNRMANYQTMVDRKIQQYGLPSELAAVPILESGYTNYHSPTAIGAGLWGFVKGTARRYHLVVEGTVDERLDEEKETDAAMRYFRDLFGRFHDWRLALKAYNEGENAVQMLIDELGTSDAWAIEKKLEGKEQYLAKMTAILLIVKNPSLLD